MNFIERYLKLWMVILFTAFFYTVNAQSESEAAIADIQQHRKEKHDSFKADGSPLPPKERRKFKGMKYYPIDLSYRVPATFVRKETPFAFKMKTTTSRMPDYATYGEVHFTLNGKDYMLEVYQSKDLLTQAGYEDYLFIPFTDETNGKETYEVGRYLELRIPSTDQVILDFNKCYNPYCSYSPYYSCPIPPAANHLPIEIKAGEKKYKEHKK